MNFNELVNQLDQIGRVAVSDLSDTEKLLYIAHATDYAGLQHVFVYPNPQIEALEKLAELGLLDIKIGENPKTVTVLQANVPLPMYNTGSIIPRHRWHIYSEEKASTNPKFCGG